jgi:histidyl-tRNA synthetase
VFEFVHGGLGAQSGLGGGGRYDQLVAELGGPDLPAAGFGVGLERLLLALEQEGVAATDAVPCDVFVAGDLERAFALATALRRQGLAADFDPLGRSLRAQLRHADRLGARFAAILGAPGEPLALRDMGRQEQRPVAEEAAAVAAAVRV